MYMYIPTQTQTKKRFKQKHPSSRLLSRPSFPVPVPRPKTTVVRWSLRGFARALIRRYSLQPRWARAVPVELAPPDGGQSRCAPWPCSQTEPKCVELRKIKGRYENQRKKRIYKPCGCVSNSEIPIPPLFFVEVLKIPPLPSLVVEQSQPLFLWEQQLVACAAGVWTKAPHKRTPLEGDPSPWRRR